MLFNKDLALRSLGLGLQVDRMHNGECPLCGTLTPPPLTKDARKRFDLTGLCVTCEDSINDTLEGEIEDLTSYIDTEREISLLLHL